ncbi:MULTISPECIES: rhomboid family intramembrane serine protease [unclassified Granulicatella]|uniref:rhomboid family intramembrane serine protease n=1 Tax=unclassified Granulicatella TaxID=2630493 RepID=UPI001430FA0D|nr:rhomboid family intramembrane serine protease [Granulicatella sp. WM01]MBF0780991.1 rhomboid family intramembrane serine protease [Granulicatella sp. 19428wC4_WM01]
MYNKRNKVLKGEKMFNRFKNISTYMQATIVLILINCIVFLVTLSKGATVDVFIQYGAMYKPLVQFKYEFWRFFTAMFLHADAMHLTMNVYSLYLAGKILEPIFGTYRFLLIYFAGGLLGNLFSYGLHGISTVSLGASSAVFGLFSTIVLLTKVFPHHKGIYIQSQQFFVVICINLIYSLSPGIDLWSHVGGLIGGGLAGYCLGSWQIKPQQKVISIVIYIGLLLSMFFIGFN